MVKRWDVPLSWVARFFGLFVSISTIPHIITNVGIEGYSDVALIQALLPWLLLLDMGTGNYLKNLLTVRTNSFLLKKVVVGVTLILASLFVLFFLVFYISWEVVDKLYLSGEGTYEFFYPFLLLALVAQLEIYTKFLYSFFKSSVVSFTNILSFMVVFLLVFQSKSTEPADYLMMMLLPVFVSKLFLALYFFRMSGIGFFYLKFSFSRYLKLAHFCIKKSKNFWILAIMGTFIVSVDVFIASQFLDSTEIAVYLIILRLYLAGYTLISSFVHIYWPRITIIITKRQSRELYILLFSVFSLFSVAIVVSTLFLNFAISYFDNVNAFQELNDSNINVSMLLFSFALLFIIRLWVDLFSTALQSVGDTKLIIRLMPLQLISGLVCQVFLAKIFGPVGLVIGLAFSYFVVMAYPLPREVYLKLTKTSY
ncbi:lipopolysaccharide biosynthesis protein [Agarivorans sp. 1_MG-2023]|uniref:lipopolysaccharide biosynthesis protein n=1 Tax=Agarivorans sp. 1_MG-2023 TaxID=3062634 RepID=UPI0026E25226|nr:hypothetical protein [Agarivorans sp. 1_MG-2023]MDO6764801.1 hypothetical protein [Agarivorans sp. 1_MG-2023]